MNNGTHTGEPKTSFRYEQLTDQEKTDYKYTKPVNMSQPSKNQILKFLGVGLLFITLLLPVLAALVRIFCELVVWGWGLFGLL